MAVGIIAEYNPFHAGHAYQISEIKKITDAEIIAVMSGSFMQRGLPTILILGGVDLVLELPFISAVRSAQDFARGGIRLLKSLGVVDTLAFGAEVADLQKLKLAAKTFEDKNFTEKLHALMSQGISYAAAVTKILANVAGLAEENLRQPNTILAIEYLRALPEEISPLIIKRIGAAYDDLTLQENLSSASAIRAALYKESPLWEKISAQVDAETLNALRAEKISGLVDDNLLFRPIIAKLLTSRADELKKIYGMAEGLEFKLLNATSAKNLSELLKSLIGRRYTASRIRRLLLHFLLNVTAEEVSELDAATCIKILAFNERGRKLLKKITAPTVTKVTKHVNQRDICERRRILEPYQPRDFWKDFSTPPIFIA